MLKTVYGERGRDRVGERWLYLKTVMERGVGFLVNTREIWSRVGCEIWNVRQPSMSKIFGLSQIVEAATWWGGKIAGEDVGRDTW
jgi:hypothetical protein